MHLCCERVKWLRIGFCDVHEVRSSYFWSGEYDHFVIMYLVTSTVFTGPWASSFSLFTCNVATIRHPSLSRRWAWMLQFSWFVKLCSLVAGEMRYIWTFRAYATSRLRRGYSNSDWFCVVLMVHIYLRFPNLWLCSVAWLDDFKQYRSLLHHLWRPCLLTAGWCPWPIQPVLK